MILYWLGVYFFRIIFKIIWRVKIYGIENVPLKGGVILAANHASYADPPLAGCFLKRPTHFFAKQELFNIPIFGWIIKRTNAFPVKRFEQDMAAFKYAQRLLMKGEVLVIFPEGTRRRPWKEIKPRPGVGMLSVITGAPVIPVGIVNNDKFAKLARLKLIYGKPIFFDKGDYYEIANRVMDEIEILRQEGGKT